MDWTISLTPWIYMLDPLLTNMTVFGDGPFKKKIKIK